MPDSPRAKAAALEHLSVLEKVVYDLSNNVGLTLNYLEIIGHDENGWIRRAKVTKATELASRSVTSLKRLMREMTELRSLIELYGRPDPKS